MLLDLTSLEKAVAQLEEALEYCASRLAQQDDRLALHLRAGAIQAFEFSYELSLKMIKRYLSLTEANPSIIDEMTFNELLRKAYEKGLIKSELAAWKEFRRERGRTSHTYDEEKAQAVFEDIPIFLQDAQFLLNSLKQRSRHNIE